jgi:hypothetical protein
MSDLNTLAEAYLTHYRTGDNSLFDAFNQVDALVRDLERGLPICLALIDAARDDAELAYVAAGPLEDLIHRVGEPARHALAPLARRSSKVRQAMAGVW